MNNNSNKREFLPFTKTIAMDKDKNILAYNSTEYGEECAVLKMQYLK